MKEIYDTQLKDYVVRVSSPAWVVKNVKPHKDYTLELTFIGGERKLYNALPLLEKGIYAPLKNIVFFMQAKVEGDSVSWNEEIDISPEHLYECSTPIK